jgi:starch phosphorylase
VSRTNGIAHRRWLGKADPALARLLDAEIGPNWRTNLALLSELRPLAEDTEFRRSFRAVKDDNKQRLAAFVAAETGISLDPRMLFDVHIKRIHEYKRQLLNVLHVVTRANRIAANPDGDWVRRAVVFAGKAAPAYSLAKLIIHLIGSVGRTIAMDRRTSEKLAVAFLPNYSVSLAEKIIPVADLSEQISTAGFEASGTGNIKLALNGALAIGTHDGANIEICDQVGAENMFLFGLNAAEVQQLRQAAYDPAKYYDADPELRLALDQIGSGHFSPEEPGRYRAIIDALLRNGDYYMLLSDYRAYVECQERVDALYGRADEWTRRSVLNVAGMGPFFSDETIRSYADGIWNIRPLALDGERG